MKRGGFISKGGSSYEKSLSHILHIIAYFTYHAYICIPNILFAYSAYSAYNTYFIKVCLLISSIMAGYELSDDEGDIPPSPSQSPHQPNDDLVDLQPPAHIQQPPIMIAPPPSFDFHDFMRWSGGKTASLFQTIRQVDALLPREPIIVHSQRAGGGNRLLYLVICCILSIFGIFGISRD